jgi:hypothetical protein
VEVRRDFIERDFAEVIRVVKSTLLL